jgi:membrane-associated protein
MNPMDTLKHLIDFVLHLNKHMETLVHDYGPWVYLFLFLIVFAETGLVVTPFLPGDSLLFATGAICAGGSLDVTTMILLLIVAAILGDTVNYAIGYRVGPKVFHRPDSRWLNKQHLLRAHEFYEKYGGKAIVFARFIPIIRTFAPFVAGIGSMTYRRFMMFNVAGGIVWVVSFLLAGYFFGNIPAVKRNFTYVIMGIIVVSMLPPVYEYLKHRRTKAK